MSAVLDASALLAYLQGNQAQKPSKVVDGVERERSR